MLKQHQSCVFLGQEAQALFLLRLAKEWRYPLLASNIVAGAPICESCRSAYYGLSQICRFFRCSGFSIPMSSVHSGFFVATRVESAHLVFIDQLAIMLKNQVESDFKPESSQLSLISSWVFDLRFPNWHQQFVSSPSQRPLSFCRLALSYAFPALSLHPFSRPFVWVCLGC